MKIGIDASRYSHEQATGVENYSRQIIDAIKRNISDDDELVLYTRENLKAKRLWTLRALTKEMKKNPPDVLFVPSHVLPLRLPERSVITIHDVAFMHLKEVYSFFQYHYLKWSTKYAVKHADKIIVPSKATQDDLEDYFKCPKEKIVVVPHGFTPPSGLKDLKFADVDFCEHFGVTENTKYFLFVGRLESKKNLERLVEAFAKFSEKHSDYKLLLAGKRGVGFQDITKKIADLKLADKVVIPGYIDDNEKALLFKHCVAFTFPSLYEGFGLPLLEAFYYGKPVLCSDFSALPEVAGKACYLVDPEDTNAIAAGLEKLASDPEYVEALVAEGKNRLGEYSWETSAKQTLKVLHG